ncbi:MAG: bifunctional diaminohydroxyphosphoribosylaminopyrimidine deaminase/5-amino-6-(5-phosphoribosylamino)uracil reductase RibD [Rhodospirillales bacterium]
MRAAIALSRRALGTTWPNPPVGCVIASATAIVGQGVTAAGGRPHAETQALAMAGVAARGATAFVTLEPCSHHGQTPPCADALVEAGVARVVVAAGDPDPRVNGAGIGRLRAAGIEVIEGVESEAATDILAGFFSRVVRGRPLVTLKLASTLDGRIATSTGESQWITGTPARKAAHAMRGRHDAVLVGVGTVLADDPDLTCRIPGYTARPTVRLVLDSHLRTPLMSRLVATAADIPTWILHRDGADPARIEALSGAGVRCIEIAHDAAGIDPMAALTVLADAGLTAVLAEGGARLAASLLRAGAVDRLAWFAAPSILGGDGLPAVQAMGIDALAEQHRFSRVAQRPVGDDLLTEFRKIA